MNRFEQAVYDCMNPTAELLEHTTKPLHRAMLLNFWRHVHLEGAGRFEEIVAPDMMVDEPVYRITWGANPVVVTGKEGVVSFYRAVGEAVLWNSDDFLAVGDWGIADELTFHQIARGADLRAIGYDVDDPDAHLPRLEPAGVHLAVRQPGAARRREPLRGQDEPRDRGGGPRRRRSPQRGFGRSTRSCSRSSKRSAGSASGPSTWSRRARPSGPSRPSARACPPSGRSHRPRARGPPASSGNVSAIVGRSAPVAARSARASIPARSGSTRMPVT